MIESHTQKMKCLQKKREQLIRNKNRQKTIPTAKTYHL